MAALDPPLPRLRTFSARAPDARVRLALGLPGRGLSLIADPRSGPRRRLARGHPGGGLTFRVRLALRLPGRGLPLIADPAATAAAG
jgi:hypothetical protein